MFLRGRFPSSEIWCHKHSRVKTLRMLIHIELCLEHHVCHTWCSKQSSKCISTRSVFTPACLWHQISKDLKRSSDEARLMHSVNLSDVLRHLTASSCRCQIETELKQKTFKRKISRELMFHCCQETCIEVGIYTDSDCFGSTVYPTTARPEDNNNSPIAKRFHPTSASRSEEREVQPSIRTEQRTNKQCCLVAQNALFSGMDGGDRSASSVPISTKGTKNATLRIWSKQVSEAEFKKDVLNQCLKVVYQPTCNIRDNPC